MGKRHVFQSSNYLTEAGMDEFEEQFYEFYHEHHGDILAAIHNKGPFGYKKETGRNYGNRAKNIYKEMRKCTHIFELAELCFFFSSSFDFDLNGAVMASDAFFPFPDCVEIAHKEGISAVIQPGGSIKDELSINYCNDNGVSMVFTGNRHFKH